MAEARGGLGGAERAVLGDGEEAQGHEYLGGIDAAGSTRSMALLRALEGHYCFIFTIYGFCPALCPPLFFLIFIIIFFHYIYIYIYIL